MRSLVADPRLEPSDETARLPSLPSSFLPESAADEAVDGKVAVLGPTLRFKGELTAQEDFILQGRIEGSVQQAQRIVIAPEGVVIGSVHARVVVVDGNVEGDLHAVESVIVHQTGRVIGNIFAPRVSLAEGAIFNGRIDMGGAAAVEQVPTPQVSTSQLPAPQLPTPQLSTPQLPASPLSTQKVSLVLPPPPVRRSIA
jgi:cytoskeletal protein CcmA (bactofilin family)